MNILVTGGSGFVGKNLIKKLKEDGHHIFLVTREHKESNIDPRLSIIEWDLSRSPLRDASLAKIDGVVNLMGESIQGLWTQEKKDRIYISRVRGTKNLIESFVGQKLKFFISASAVGYYGNRGDQLLSEDSIKGEGFLSDICASWEKEIEIAQNKKIIPNCRWVVLRIGMVVSALGGAVPMMRPAFQYGLAGKLGSGSQYMSWIALEDLVGMIVFSCQNSNVRGTFNAVAPHPVTNLEWTKLLSAHFKKRPFLGVPSFLLKMILGDMSSILLDSIRADSEKITKMGYKFIYPSLEKVQF